MRRFDILLLINIIVGFMNIQSHYINIEILIKIKCLEVLYSRSWLVMELRLFWKFS